MKLSFQEIVLLKTILNLSGEMEPGEDGKEKFSLRKLNGQESSQRRHFTKNTDAVVNAVNEKARELQGALNDLKKTLEDEYTKESPLVNEKLHELTKQSNDEYKGLAEAEHEIEVTGETKALVKRVFTEWGEKIGFVASEDEIIAKLEEKLS